MLKLLQIQNFKSFDTADLPLDELTVLIGRNGAGKTNLIEALRLLSWLARGFHFDELRRTLIDEGVVRAGPLVNLLKVPTHIGLECTIADGPRELRLSTTLDYLGARGPGEDAFALGGERLEVRERADGPWTTYYKLERLDDDRWGARYETFGAVGPAPVVEVDSDQAAFAQLTTPARFAQEYPEARTRIPSAAALVRSTLLELLVVKPVPSRMRGFSFRGREGLRWDASNISGVVADLDRRGLEKELLAFVTDLPESPIAGIEFVVGRDGELMLQLRETYPPHDCWRDAGVLSDGTLHVLAVAAALLSVTEGAVVVIDGIDEGLHPNRARSLLENIRRVAQRRGLRVVVTTHDPALLDALPLAEIGNVLFCYRDVAKGDSRLVRLRDIPDSPGLLAQGSLGDLVTQGLVERFAKFPKTNEQKAKELEETLAILRGDVDL